MQTWEYHLSRTPDFNALGEDGWELIAVRDGEHIFKRASPPAAERFTQEQRQAALKGAATAGEPPRLLNPLLASLARRIGHTQTMLVCDCGFPVPLNLPLGVVDLSVTSNVPTVTQVLGALLPELPHDRIIVAQEMQEKSPERWAWHKAHRSPLEAHPHRTFKQLASEALCCVRTGDSTPYGNVLVVGG